MMVSPAARARVTSRGPSAMKSPATRRPRPFRRRSTSLTRGLSTEVITDRPNLAALVAATVNELRQDCDKTPRDSVRRSAG